jgi:hypothetical protein
MQYKSDFFLKKKKVTLATNSIDHADILAEEMIWE